MYKVSKLIASTGEAFSSKQGRQTIVVDFIGSSDINSLLSQLHAARSHAGKSLSLHFENIRSNAPLPVIDVYLNLQQESMPQEENYVGPMALYGLNEASAGKQEEQPAQQRVFDVGEVFSRVCTQSNWSEKQFRLSLHPYNPLPDTAKLTIECVTLYFQES